MSTNEQELLDFLSDAMASENEETYKDHGLSDDEQWYID